VLEILIRKGKIEEVEDYLREKMKELRELPESLREQHRRIYSPYLSFWTSLKGEIRDENF